MTDKTREELLQVVEELSALYPEWRFGQLVVNVANWASAETGRDVYDVDDEDFLAEAKAHLHERAADSPVDRVGSVSA